MDQITIIFRSWRVVVHTLQFWDYWGSS